MATGALLAVDLINAVIDFPAGRKVSGLTVLDPFVPSDSAEGKVSILDVRARDDPGRQLLLEMHLFVRAGFAKRLLFYWAGAHAEQLPRGWRYEMLHPGYTICFLGEELFPDEASHHRFRVYDDEHATLLCKDLEIHVIELGKFDVPADQVQKALQRWCYFFKHGASLEPASLPATLDVPVIRQAMEVLVKVSKEELERQRYLERQRAERDADSLAEDARVARQEGLEKGTTIGRIQLLQPLLGQPETSREDLDRLSEPDLAEMDQLSKQQLTGKKEDTPPAAP